MRSEIMDARAAARVVGLAHGTLAKMRLSGTGPVFLKLNRAVRYRRSDLDKWLASRARMSTSDKGGADE